MVHFGLIQIAKKHTEIFGTFYELILKNNWDLTVYYDLDQDEYTFVTYYNKLFNYEKPIKRSKQFIEDIDDLDFLIFASSSDEYRLPEEYKNMNIAHKCIFVHHQAVHIFPYMVRNITVTPVIQTPHLNSTLSEYLLPIYKTYKSLHWKPVTNKIIFGIVGAIRGVNNGKTVDRNLNLVNEIITKYPDGNYEFWFFMRKWDWRWICRKYKFLRENPKIIGFPGLKTENMIKVLHQVKFILPLSKKGGWFYWERLTGSIPLAINFNIPLLIDRELAEIYGLQDYSICYDEWISEVYEKLINMTDEEYYQIIVKLVKYKKEATKKIENNFIRLCIGQILNKHLVGYYEWENNKVIQSKDKERLEKEAKERELMEIAQREYKEKKEKELRELKEQEIKKEREIQEKKEVNEIKNETDPIKEVKREKVLITQQKKYKK